MPTPVQEFSCVSAEGPNNNPGFGALFPAGASSAANRFYPIGIAEWSSWMGRTWEIFFYTKNTSPNSDQVLRRTTENGFETWRIGYRHTGDPSGAGRWEIKISSTFQVNTTAFNFGLVPSEWYHMVIRAVPANDTVIAPEYTNINNRMIINIGRVGVRSDGVPSLGPNTFPYGLGPGSGVSQPIQIGSFPYHVCLRPYGLYTGGDQNVRAAWGGTMFASGTDPVFTDAWQGGYCEERLWALARNNTEINQYKGNFAPVNSPVSYIRFNETLGDLESYPSTQNQTSAGQVGFAKGGSSGAFSSTGNEWINHVDPGLNTAGENSTGYPAHPFRPPTQFLSIPASYEVTIDGDPFVIQGEYIVSETNSDAKPGSYSVNSAGAPIENDGDYFVLADGTPFEISGTYRVLSDEEDSKPGSYVVVIDGTDAQTGDYTVLSAGTPVENDGDYVVVYSPTDLEVSGDYVVLTLAGSLPNSGDYVVNAGATEIFMSGGYKVFTDAVPLAESGDYAVVTDATPLANTGSYEVSVSADIVSGISSYLVAVDATPLSAPASYEVAGANEIPILGDYRVLVDGLQIEIVANSYFVALPGTPIEVSGDYEVVPTDFSLSRQGSYVVGGQSFESIERSGKYVVELPAGSEIDLLRSKYDWLRMNTGRGRR